MARDSAEELYDRYLDACLTGEVEEPGSFFARHPELDTHGRERITVLHDVLADAPDDAVPFERLGDYRLLRRIGRGGMGTVYLAEQESLNRVVALKIVRPELATSETALKRFEREAHAIAKLRHPSVVTVYEFGTVDDVRYIAMELVPGRTLASIIADGRPRVHRAVAWARELAFALEQAHAAGVVHRDVKPGNILITPEDRPVLLDFGMAHLSEATRMTRTFAGSPSYAAPEQVSQHAPDRRTDVYALGVTLYECVTGKLPFEGGSLEGTFQRILVDEPIPPRKLNPAVDVATQTVILKAMEKRRRDRYPTAAAFAADLDALLEARPIRARPPGAGRRVARYARRHPARAAVAATLTVALLATIAIGAYRGWREQQDRRASAQQALADARTLVTSYRTARLASVRLERRYQQYVNRSESGYMTDAEDAEFTALGQQREGVARQREAVVLDVLDLLRRAERLDGDIEGTDAVRAALYVEKMQEAEAAHDFVKADVFRARVRTHDPDGTFTAELSRTGQLELKTDPRGARVEVAGIVGRTPFEPALAPGDYVARLAADGREDAVYAFTIKPGEKHERELTLAVAGETPNGFVYLPINGGYWIGGTEVTCAAYLEFVNAVDAHVPRGPGGTAWKRKGGRYVIPDDWHPNWPVLGVSYADAVAYAGWLSERDGRTYALPTRFEWTTAAGGETRRTYAFGNVFRPKWCSSCFARPKAAPVPVGSYPKDRSPYGVLDMAGSAAEWLDDWFDEGRNLRRLGGSSWGMTDPKEFAIWGGMQATPDAANYNYGIRLVIRR